MSNFKIALDKLKPPDQEILDGVLKRWGEFLGIKKEKVIENFKREHFLSVPDLVDIFGTMIKNKRLETRESINLARRLFHEKYQLRGGTIKTPKPQLVGFALSKEDYKNHLMRHYGSSHFDEDDGEIDKFLNNGLNNLNYNFLFKSNSRLIWLTWDREDNDHPFSFLQYELSKEVCITLALDTRYFEPPLYLFTVCVEKISEPEFDMLRPTFCDSDFYEGFSPTPLGFDLFGLAVPTENEVHDLSGNFYPPKEMPEALTRSKYIKLSNLEKVIYLAS